jgi:hypothetical protein
MRVAKSAVLLHLDTVGVISFILTCRVIALFAVGTSKSNNNPHYHTPPGLTVKKA